MRETAGRVNAPVDKFRLSHHFYGDLRYQSATPRVEKGYHRNSANDRPSTMNARERNNPTPIDPVKLDRLAEVAIKVGLQLKPGQDLLVTAPTVALSWNCGWLSRYRRIGGIAACLR